MSESTKVENETRPTSGSSSRTDAESETSKKSEDDDGPPPAPIPRSSTPQLFKNPVTFRECFRSFSKFGDTKSDGKFITLSQSDKWMKQAKVIDGKKITTTDTGIFFKKFKQQKLNVTDYEKFLVDLTKNKNLNVEEVKRQMGGCGTPGLSSNTPVKVPNAFDRLTDTSKYTGSHKLRFDESGKGKGIEGRKDVADSSGDELSINNNDKLSEDAEATLQQIIRDPPCRLSFPQGCPFVILESPNVTNVSNDSENEEENKNSYIELSSVDKIEDGFTEVNQTEIIQSKKNVNFKSDVMKKRVEVDDDEMSDKFDDEDEALEYDNEDNESVEEEEDWDNIERDSDDYYSSSS